MSEEHLRQYMNKFIESPNLPESRVDTILLGNHPNIIEKIEKIGINCRILSDNDLINISVKNHGDMAACYMGQGKIFVDRKQEEVIRQLRKMGMEVYIPNRESIGDYPNDVVLNCAVIGENMIYSKKGTAKEIVDMGQEKIHFAVKQGYCRCSVCPIDENAIITDDVSIYRAVKDFMDVLLIEKGDIILNGKDYGFIGGATGKIDKDTLLFFGDMETHRNSVQIKKFLEEHGVNYINLFKGNLVDIGGIIPITQK